VSPVVQTRAQRGSSALVNKSPEIIAARNKRNKREEKEAQLDKFLIALIRLE